MTSIRPWREVAIPHSDVLKGTFQQAEFAADISAVRSGNAPDIYKDAALFFDRTYITEGMALLLTQVAQRLAGRGASRSSNSRRPSAAVRRTHSSQCSIWRRGNARSRRCPAWHRSSRRPA